MRILSVSNCPLDPSLGSGYVITGYAEQLLARGHKVRLLGPGQYEWMPRLRMGKRLRVLLGYSLVTLRALQRESFDVLELWGAEGWFVARRLARRAKRPLMVARSNGLEPHLAHWMSEYDRTGRAPGIGARVFDHLQDQESAFRLSDLVTTVSEFDRRYALARNHQPPERVLALENPLPNEWLDSPVPERRPLVLAYFGSWLERKGSDVICAVLPEVLRAHPGWRARLIGVGELDRAAVFPDDVASRIEIVSFVSNRERLRAMYEEAAVVIMPSRYESFGLVAAEAMARGCALVASCTGLAADLRHEEHAVIVEGLSTQAWRRELTELLGDEGRRQRVARGGRQRVQSLRWQQKVERLLGSYETLLHRQG